MREVTLSPGKHSVAISLIFPSGHSIICFHIKHVCLDSIQAIVDPPFCLEANQKYVLRIEFSRFGGNQNVPTASILIDSVSVSSFLLEMRCTY